jgi:hypothetical protein
MTGTGARSVHLILLGLATGATLLCGKAAAFAGPCSEQIAQIEEQVTAPPARVVPAPQSAPTDTQSVGAQLHHQPTPGSVAQAEHTANNDGTAAIDRAKKADAAGDAVGCNEAVAEARRVYAIKN